jgi:hypothetical protein
MSAVKTAVTLPPVWGAVAQVMPAHLTVHAKLGFDLIMAVLNGRSKGVHLIALQHDGVHTALE